jgi:Ran GTPase-activating protein (RanGAP) involved in mRNA processing and transport
MKINDDGILEIMETIQQEKPTTTNIDLDNNNLSDKGAIILSKYLCDFKNLTELSVQFNNIGKEGAADLFSLKKVFSDLDILFHGNKITDADEMEEIERLALRGSPQSGQ